VEICARIEPPWTAVSLQIWPRTLRTRSRRNVGCCTWP
jgi:hypothetical protein